MGCIPNKSAVTEAVKMFFVEEILLFSENEDWAELTFVSKYNVSINKSKVLAL
jgi:hypothetical protein